MRFFINIFILSCFFFVSCASTSVSYEVERPANVDLEKIKTVSILPTKPIEKNKIIYHEAYSNKFSLLSEIFYFFYEYKPEQKKSLNLLEKELIENINESPYLTYIDSNLVQDALQKNKDVPTEIYITSEVTNLNVDDETRVIHVIENNGKEEDRFCRKVRMTINYNIIDAKNTKTILSDSYTMESFSNETDSRFLLKGVYKILKKQIPICATKIINNLQPHNDKKNIELLKIKTKNKDIKEAEKLAKKNFLQESSNKFYKGYRETSIFEAGYNAAILQLVLKNFTEAENQMQTLYEKTKDERALQALKDIQYEIDSEKKLKKQLQNFNKE